MADNFKRIAAAINFLREEYSRQPSLEECAEKAGLSPYHFQRLFKEYAGISPKRFCQHLLNQQAKSVLNRSVSLLDASFELGLSSPSRLHDLLVSVDAVTPGEYRRLGKHLQIYYAIHLSPFGPCLLAVTGRGICSLEFIDDSPHQALARLRSDWPEATLYVDRQRTGETFNQIFPQHNSRKAPLPLLLKGTNFQIKVWRALLKIPEGSLISYSDLATRIDEPRAHRAVANAVGRNPLAYLIPCHRVLRSDGTPGGYHWGIERKLMILARELSSAC